MSDVSKWKVHGPVRTLRTEFGEWDLAQEDWQPFRDCGVVTFHPDGRADESRHHNPDGSVAIQKFLYDDVGRLVETQFRVNDEIPSRVLRSYEGAGRHIRTTHLNPDASGRETEISTYDRNGRKTTVRFLDPEKPSTTHAYRIEGAEGGYAAPGATTMTVAYDDNNRPTEVLFHNEHNALLRRVIFVRDNAGKLLSKEQQFGGETPFSGMEKRLESASPEDRARLMAVVAKAFGPSHTLSSTNYVYDEKDRLVERTERHGALAARV